MKYSYLRTICLVWCSLISLTIAAQDYSRDERTLFSVDGNPVSVSEFDYIYNKNNAANADYSEKTLKEYLDLYINFKLKVRRARELQMDTIPTLQRELAGYRRQLAESYLMDKEVKNRLVEEAYEREQKDVHISHILIRMRPNPTNRDTLAAYERIMNIRAQIMDGMPFDEAASNYSQDRTAKENGGDMGYISAILPRGYYALETAMYTLEPGEVSMPVRSPRGYHLIKKHDEREAVGEVEIAHIFVNKGKSPQAKEAARARINKLYTMLQNGQKFEDLASRNSDDQKTAQKGGYIGFIQTGLLDPEFEALAFSLPSDGAYSGPFESENGFHIVKRISKRELLPLAQERRRIENEIAKTERMEIAKQRLIEQIKENANYKFHRNTYAKFASQLDSSFFMYQWKPPGTENEPVLTIGNVDYTDKDFAKYLQQNKRPRMQMARKMTVNAGLENMFEQFVNDMCLEYEERNLEQKYPDFKALMREYEEGILLFELTKDKVWDKASKDTIGLQKFYDKNNDRYMWENRILVNEFAIDSANMELINEMHEKAKKKKAKKLKKKYSRKGLEIELTTNKYEERIAESKELPWTDSYVSELEYNVEENSYYFLQIQDMLKPETKSLSEARGYIIADYQDYLENQWLEELKDRYEVEVNEEVFNSLIK